MFAKFDKEKKVVTVLVENGNESVGIEIKTDNKELNIAVAYGEVFVVKNYEYYGNNYDVVSVKEWLNDLIGDRYHPASNFVTRIVNHEVESYKRRLSE